MEILEIEKGMDIKTKLNLYVIIKYISC